MATSPSGWIWATGCPSTRTVKATSALWFSTVTVSPRGTTSGRAWSECARCRGRRLRELGDVPEPFALRAQPLLVVRFHPFRRLGEGAQLRELRLCERGVRRQLVVPPPRREQLPPRGARLGALPQLFLAAEAVEHLELVGRPSKPPLLELAGHRDDALDRRGDVLPGGSSAPGVGARASVPKDSPRDEQRILVLRE